MDWLKVAVVIYVSAAALALAAALVIVSQNYRSSTIILAASALAATICGGAIQVYFELQPSRARRYFSTEYTVDRQDVSIRQWEYPPERGMRLVWEGAASRQAKDAQQGGGHATLALLLCDWPSLSRLVLGFGGVARECLSPRAVSRGVTTNDFGNEAIDTLVKRMEDHRSDLVVIAAGYEEEMDALLESNPGLSSRFPWRFRFSHYSSSELLEVFQHLAAEDGMQLDAGCTNSALALFASHAGRDRSFGNGRFARTVYEKARVRQAARLWQAGAVGVETNERLQTLLSEDLPPDSTA